MRKINKHFTIDQDVAISMIGKEHNYSCLVNNFLRSFLEVSQEETPKQELINKKNLLIKEVNDVKIDIAKIESQIISIEDIEKKEQEEHYRKQEAFTKGLKNAGMLRNIGR